MFSFSTRALSNRVRLFAVVVLGVALAVTFGAPSHAEYEVPFVENASTQARVEFRGIWSFNRGTDHSSAPAFEGYEAYAVGVDPTNADQDRNGVVFYNTGQKWQKVVTPFSTTTAATPFEMNAVTGQINHGYGAPALMVAGTKSRLAYIDNFIAGLGSNVSPDTGYLTYGQFVYSKFYRNNPGPGWNPVYGIPVQNAFNNLDRPFYAVDAAQTYGKEFVAGGKTDGVDPTGKGAIAPWEGSASTASQFHGPVFAVGGPTTMFFTVPANLHDYTRENITGIRFVDLSTAYITTSTFRGNADRYSPDGRTCADAGSQQGYLYRASAADNFKTWTRLGGTTGCFYGLSVGKLSSGSVRLGTTSTRLPHAIWIATNNGVLRYREYDGLDLSVAGAAESVGLTRMTGTENTFLYSVSSTPDRSGEGVNQIQNGTFTNWVTSKDPDGWIRLDPQWGFNGGPTCGTNDDDVSRVADPDDASNDVLQVWPARMYSNAGCTTPYTSLEPMGVFTRANTPPSDGQRFHITGRYRVEFKVPRGVPADQVDAEMPTLAEGGVAIGCTGANDQPGTHRNNQCSLRIRKYIETYNAAAPSTGTNGWKNIDIYVSRQDLNIKQYLISSAIILTPRKFDLEVRCEATFGAKVRCDDLKVEEITTPQVRGRDDFYVVGVGQANTTVGQVNRTVVTTQNGAALSPTFSNETQPQYTDDPAAVTATNPSGVRYDYQAVFASGVQHVFVAGSGFDRAANTSTATGPDTFLTRAPSTLVGYVWVGTNGTTNPTTPGNTGQISVSCINNKTSAGVTLCQRASESYGWSMGLDRFSATLNGHLSGRAWFGKQATDFYSDQEHISAGVCVGAPTAQINSSEPYNLGATCTAGFCQPDPTNRRVACSIDADCTLSTCDRITSTISRCSNQLTRSCTNDRDCHQGGACDEFSRRCWANSAHTTYSNVSCLTDVDCFGKCSNDAGHYCTTNADCGLTATSVLSTTSTATGRLTSLPAETLRCSPTTPQACASFGWLSLDAADFPGTAANAPVGGESIGVRFNWANMGHNTAAGLKYAGYHELSGWGRFTTLSSPTGICSLDANVSCDASADCSAANNNGIDKGSCVTSFSTDHGNGWVRFRGPAATVSGLKTLNVIPQGRTTAQSVSYLVSCQDCTDYDPGDGRRLNCAFCANGTRQSCSPSNTAKDATYNSICTNFCDNTAPGDPMKECILDGECGAGGHCVQQGVCTGNYSTICASSDDCGSAGGVCTFGAFCRATTTGPAAPTCAAYGVNMSVSTGKYYGFAWSEDFGWLDFRSVGRAGSRFIKTQLGSIYAGGSIGDATQSQPQGINNCNATFLILAGGTIASNWCSALGETGRISSVSTTNLVIPDESRQYTNALGRVDIRGIETVVSGTGVNSKNKYGSGVVTIDADVGTGDFSTALKNDIAVRNNVLGGKVYVVPECPVGGCTIESSISFNNSNDLNAYGSANGIIIVHGDLTINRPLTYGTSVTATDPRGVAAVTFVVTGKMTIATTVQSVAGAYLVQGADGVSTISTQAGAETNPLKIYGLLIAKKFVFGRRVAGTVERPEPSENIIYDGRLQTNPMPGLVDFARVLPAQVNQP